MHIMCYSYYEVEFLEGNDPIQVLRNLIIPPKTVYKKIRKILQENTLCFMLNTHTHTHTHTFKRALLFQVNLIDRMHSRGFFSFC